MSIDTRDFYTGGPGGNNTPQVYPIQFEDNQCFRYTDKSANQSERNIYSNYWRELINLYGQRVDYYVSTVSVVSADLLYGEQPTARYAPPLPLIVAINLNENALMLSKYGLLSEDEVTAFVHISAFYDRFGIGAEPKSGDVFQLSEYGSDRPNGRDGRYYEITERLDQDIAQINPLAGHYVWLLKAKRFEWSFEPGLSGSAVNSQVYEDTLSPTASGAYKPYSFSIDNDVYGGYY
jgi:hypothetical protein